MKEAAYTDELKALAEFKNTRNDWFVKETRRRGRKATPKVQDGKGSSSKPKKKQKKAAKTLLIDEPKEDEPAVTVEEDIYAESMMFNVDVLESGPTVNVEAEQAVNVEAEQAINVEAGKEKVIDDVEGDDRKRQEKDDDAYVPSPEHVYESQSPSGSRKKAGARKKVVSPKIRKLTSKISKPKIILKKKPSKESRKPSTPPSEPTLQHSPPQQPTPPRQPTPPQQPSPPRQPSPLHLSQLHFSPPQQQTLLTSQEIFQTPPLTQIRSTPGSSGCKVKKLEKKMDDVINDNKVIAAESKKVSDREKILEMRVKRLETDNKELLKKIDNHQSEIDILKVRVAEIEEQKARRDE
ncbi:hypothetical protein Hanom_Chr10g00914301 [Helianthus anomalus]